MKRTHGCFDGIRRYGLSKRIAHDLDLGLVKRPRNVALDTLPATFAKHISRMNESKIIVRCPTLALEVTQHLVNVKDEFQSGRPTAHHTHSHVSVGILRPRKNRSFEFHGVLNGLEGVGMLCSLHRIKIRCGTCSNNEEAIPNPLFSK